MLKLITAPTPAPLTTDEAKTRIRVTGSADDTDIALMIESWRASVDGADGILNRALITQTWELYLDRFPTFSSIPILVPLPPVQSITFIKYYDIDGTLQTWDASNYGLDDVSEPARITPVYNVTWPATRNIPNAVIVKFVAGYGDAITDIPESIRNAGLLFVSQLYDNREKDPQHAMSLLQNYKVRMEQLY